MDVSIVTGWESFFVAMAGAAAALAGLIIVAMSVTIKEILASRSLPSRAMATIGSLVLIVIVSGLILIPGQAASPLGIELIVATVFALLLQGFSIVRITQERPRRPASENFFKFVFGVGQILPFAVGAVVVSLGSTLGVYWIAAGTLITIAYAMTNAWVLLVEVQR
jgi:hypothetical protein